jgi:hypothetical protein
VHLLFLLGNDYDFRSSVNARERLCRGCGPGKEASVSRSGQRLGSNIGDDAKHNTTECF